MKATAVIIALILTCLPLSGAESPAAKLRARLPFNTLILDTGSMRDRVHGDQLAIVMVHPFDRLKPGDWVQFWPTGWSHPLAHVLLYKQGGLWVTGGTTCLYPVAEPPRDHGYMDEDEYIGLVQLLPQPNNGDKKP